MPGRVTESRSKTLPSASATRDDGDIPRKAYRDEEDYFLFENPAKCLKYIQDLRDELSKEQMEKAAVSLERDKLKVCWQATMEQLAVVRVDLMRKLEKIQRELTKEIKRKKLMHKLLHEHGKVIQELKDLAELFFEKNNNLMVRT